jgi:hypothetical protein
VPQFFGSIDVFEHVPLQLVGFGAEQVSPHTPAAQTSPFGQTVPHVPQLVGSVCSLVQVPLQLV